MDRMDRKEAETSLKNDWYINNGNLIVEHDKVNRFLEACGMGIKALHEPERKKGHWKRFHKYEFGSDKWGYRCSECGNEIYDDDSSIIKNLLPPNFCEHCGSDMREVRKNDRREVID